MTSATDGRVLRGERNRTAIVDALLDLLEEGEARPSARMIADRAGVSLRSVFQHFEDMESLYAACVRRHHENVAPLLAPIAAEEPLAARIEMLVAQRGRCYERIAPVRRATLLAAPSSPVLRDGLRRTDALLRAQIEEVFAPELRGRDRRALVTALDLVTSFDAWERLRVAQGCTAAAARRTIAALVSATLDRRGSASPG